MMNLTLDNLRNLYALAEKNERRLPSSREELRKQRALTDKIWNMMCDIWEAENPTHWEIPLMRAPYSED